MAGWLKRGVKAVRERWGKGGAGKEAAGKPPGKAVPQDAGFGGGAGNADDPMSDFFKGSLSQKGLSNADRHKIERVRDDCANYMAQRKELAAGDTEGLNKLNDKYNVKAGADPAEHFKRRANAEATAMDWVLGNHVPQYAVGTVMLGGAVASCFSNKGKMSSSQLYGDNF